MAGAIQPDSESQANITARTHFRQLAHRARDFTTRYADILTQAVENDATPSATPQPRESTAPAYGDPPKTIEALLDRHKSPQPAETVTQTQGPDGQTTAAAGERNEPGWSCITTGESTGNSASTTAGTAGAHQPTTTGQANEHGSNTDHDEGGGDLGSGAANTMGAFAEPETGAKHRRIAETPDGHLSLRMCPRYGAMMGATTVPIDEIAATTREYNPNFKGIDRDDSNHTLYATQLIVQIEMTTAEQSLTIKECNNISATHKTPNARATAGGKPIRSVM